MKAWLYDMAELVLICLGAVAIIAAVAVIVGFVARLAWWAAGF